jgi:general secretion pathway protein D
MNYHPLHIRRAVNQLMLVPLLLWLLPYSLSAQTVSFDFEDADLRAVIQAVAEFTGRNFLVDPRVQGKVTVVAPTPLTEEDAYKLFQSVLEVNGFVTVEADGATKIVPSEEGRVRNTSVFGDDRPPNSDEMETRVLRVNYINPERMVPILRPLIPPYGHLAADPDSSSLIITDRAANVARLVNIITRLDRPAALGDIEVVPLVHASAGEMVTLLNRFYTSDEGTAGQKPGAVMMIEDTRTNSLLVRGDPTTRSQIRTLVRELDMPSENAGDTQVVFLNNANAVNLVEVLRTSVENRTGQEAAVTGGFNIMADPDTNSLIVRASKADFDTIRRVIETLDVRRLQVYVEALIAEVSTDNAREFGVQFSATDGLQGDNRGIVGTSSYTVGTSLQDVLANPLAAGAGLSLGFIDGTVTLPDGTELVNLVGLARALESQTNANILSTPNLLTMDNQEAQIIVGQNVPFVTGGYSQIGQNALDNPFQTIERRDVGLTLRIKPQITEGGTIRMEIYQEVSSVAQKGEARDIVTNTRSLSTTVIAENNRMLVLGGLIQDDVSQNMQKVPLLGDIPILGNLFRYRGNSRSKTNLLIFLRPRIVRGSADMDEPTRRKYQYLEELTRESEIWKSGGTYPPLEQWEYISADDPAGSSDEPGTTTE